MTIEPSWYRVEVAGGKIVSVERVSGIGTNTSRVYYIQAIDIDDATAAAIIRYDAYLASQRAAMKTRREHNRAAGLCSCGRKIDRKGRTCTNCLTITQDSAQRKRDRDAGLSVHKQPKSVAFARRKQEEADAIRLETLREVERIWWKLDGMKFIEWLEAQTGSTKKERAA